VQPLTTAFRVAVIVCASLLTIAACSSLPPREMQRELRVLVYNIHAGKDAKGVDNLSRVAALVRSTNADIALLQEVDRGTTRSGKVDQPRVLASLTGFGVAFGKTLEYQGGDYGIAVLSRWPIRSDSLVSLPVSPPQARAGGSYEPRGVLRATIDAPGNRLDIFNTHLDASRDDFYRRQELATVLDLASRAIEDGSKSALVGGDLNSEPASAVIDMVRGSFLRDPWPECGQGNGFSYPADRPVKRIDYLLLPAKWRCITASVIENEASDHRAVLFILRRHDP